MTHSDPICTPSFPSEEADDFVDEDVAPSGFFEVVVDGSCLEQKDRY